MTSFEERQLKFLGSHRCEDRAGDIICFKVEIFGGTAVGG